MDMQHIVAACFAQQQEERYATAQRIAFSGEDICLYTLLLIEVVVQQVHLGVDAAYSVLVVGY